MRFAFRIGALQGYLVRQNLYLTGACLVGGVFIYLLADFADRLEPFIEAGLSTRQILTYYAVKMPLIFAQLLPAVFLLGLVIQIGLLVRSKEMMALRAGGISQGWFIRFFVTYALLWSVGQLVFSQFIATYGELEANRIWREDVRKKQLDKRVLKNLWFRDGQYIVHASEARPTQSRVTDVTVYEFDRETQQLTHITTAKKALVDEQGWGLLDAWEIDPADFSTMKMLTQFLPVRQDMRSFLNMDATDKADLPIWRLSHVISELQESGSNVERLRTAWHSKLAYAFSIVTMALIALAITTITENMYLSLVISLLVVFTYYGLYVLGVSIGQKGLLAPAMAAWMANALYCGLAGLRLGWVAIPGLGAKVRRLTARS